MHPLLKRGEEVPLTRGLMLNSSLGHGTMHMISIADREKNPAYSEGWIKEKGKTSTYHFSFLCHVLLRVGCMFA